MGGNFFFILIILVPIIVIVYMFKKKKNAQSGGMNTPMRRHEGDEVWNTIKRFLKENNEKGKEIIESYVARRPDPFVVNKTLPKAQQKAQSIEIKKRKQEEKAKAKAAKKANLPYTKPVARELYVVLFATKNAKTQTADPPRAIECEIKNVKIPGKRKETEKRIEILGERDYAVESEWILPIKNAEELNLQKQQQKQAKFQKYNPINMVKKSYQQKVANNPAKQAAQEKKMLQKQQKEAAKKMKAEQKWAKKEVVVKTKK